MRLVWIGLSDWIGLAWSLEHAFSNDFEVLASCAVVDIHMLSNLEVGAGARFGQNQIKVRALSYAANVSISQLLMKRSRMALVAVPYNCACSHLTPLLKYLDNRTYALRNMPFSEPYTHAKASFNILSNTTWLALIMLSLWRALCPKFLGRKLMRLLMGLLLGNLCIMIGFRFCHRYAANYCGTCGNAHRSETTFSHYEESNVKTRKPEARIAHM